MVWMDRSLLTFAACLFLFQMANASILPLIGGILPHYAGRYSSLAMSVLVIAGQLLDGISGTVLGVLQPLIIADLTGRTGRFNLAQGFVGTVSGLGASLSTTLSGLIAGNFGLTAGFVAITAIALSALLVVWHLMPETKAKA